MGIHSHDRLLGGTKRDRMRACEAAIKHAKDLEEEPPELAALRAAAAGNAPGGLTAAQANKRVKKYAGANSRETSLFYKAACQLAVLDAAYCASSPLPCERFCSSWERFSPLQVLNVVCRGSRRKRRRGQGHVAAGVTGSLEGHECDRHGRRAHCHDCRAAHPAAAGVCSRTPWPDVTAWLEHSVHW